MFLSFKQLHLAYETVFFMFQSLNFRTDVFYKPREKHYIPPLAVFSDRMSLLKIRAIKPLSTVSI